MDENKITIIDYVEKKLSAEIAVGRKREKIRKG